MRTAFSFIEITKSDAHDRIISGRATSPRLDRHGDRINPLGVKCSGSIPLLWEHNRHLPIGTVELHKPTVDGVNFTAQIPKVSNEGELKRRIDLAWDSIVHRVVRSVSIGFLPLDSDIMESGGFYYAEIDVHELSAVSMPANVDATIENVKRFDRIARYGSPRQVRLTPEEMAVGKQLIGAA